jgi:hypothetical protein
MKSASKGSSIAETPGQKKSNKGGRPTKEEAFKKTNRIYLHLTDEEARSFHEAWQHQRLTKKISRNEFAKHRLFAWSINGESSRKLRVEDQCIKLLNQFVIQLRAIGLNYNQSVKRLNNIYLSNEVRAEITQQRELLIDITKLIHWSDQQYKQADLFSEKLNP